MIERIVLDTEKHIFEKPEKIAEKLKYFRDLSNLGLEKLSDEKIEEVQSDFNKFLNIQFYFLFFFFYFVCGNRTNKTV